MGEAPELSVVRLLGFFISSEFAGVSFCWVDFYPVKAQLVLTRAKCMNPQPVSFPNWKGVLTQANLSPAVKTSYVREIITFLHPLQKDQLSGYGGINTAVAGNTGGTSRLGVRSPLDA